jgi:hypothetical protein
MERRNQHESKSSSTASSSSSGMRKSSTPRITKTIRFRCQRIESLSEVPAFTPERCIHVKGFASRIHDSIPLSSSAQALLSSFTCYALDGDGLKFDSYTRFIAEQLLLGTTAERLADVTLIAAKYASEERQFVNSWNNRFIATSSDGTEVIIPKGSGKWTESSNSDDCVDCTVYYVLIPERPDAGPSKYQASSKGLSHYAHLGREFMAMTESSHVLCVGGGQCVQEEYTYWERRAPSTSTVPRHITWHVVDIYRVVEGERQYCFIHSISPSDDAGAAASIEIVAP